MSFEDNGFQPVRSEQSQSNRVWNQRPQNEGSNTNNNNNNYQERDNNARPNNGYNNNGGNRPAWNNNGGSGFQRNAFQRKPEFEGPVELFKPYAGTGNRETPPDVLEAFKRLAVELESRGYTLRTGGMEGPEDAFEKACKKQEIHLPWKGFNDKESKYSFTTDQAKELAGKFQPGFDGLKPAMQVFLAKNARILMGKDLKSPCLFLITWSEDGAETLQERTARTGHTGHAIAMAATLKIPIFNFGKKDAEARLMQYLGNKADGQEPQQQSSTAPNNGYNQGSNYEQRPNRY